VACQVRNWPVLVAKPFTRIKHVSSLRVKSRDLRENGFVFKIISRVSLGVKVAFLKRNRRSGIGWKSASSLRWGGGGLLRVHFKVTRNSKGNNRFQLKGGSNMTETICV
jgi:hypothetical protein